MFSGGSQLVPHLNGAIYGHKPPLLFWLIEAAWLTAGVSEIAARLVGPTAALACVGLTALIARRLWPGDPGRAGRAALIAATSPVFLIYGSATMFDALLAATVLLAVIGLIDGDWRVAGLGLGLGVLAKGPVALIHVLPLAASLPFWAPGGISARKAARVTALTLAAGSAVVALWLVPALIAGGAEYRAEILWRQSAGRVVSSFAHQRPIWFYLALVPALAWPFGWRRVLPQPGRNAGRMLAIWMLVPLLLFSLISGKQTHYLMPELPAMALLLATAPAEGPATGWLHRMLPAVPLALVAGAVIAAAAGAFGQLPMPAWAVGAALAALAAGLAGRLWLAPLSGRAAMGLALVIGLHLALAPVAFDRFDTRPIAALLAPHQQAGIAIIADRYHGQFNFTARLREPVTRLADAGALPDWAAAHPGGVVIAPADLPAPPSARLLGQHPLRSDIWSIYQLPGANR